MIWIDELLIQILKLINISIVSERMGEIASIACVSSFGCVTPKTIKIFFFLLFCSKFKRIVVTYLKSYIILLLVRVQVCEQHY